MGLKEVMRFPCPECHSMNIEYYNTAPDEKSGRYRCRDCGRDTIWKELKAESFEEIAQRWAKQLTRSSGLYKKEG